MENVPLFDVSSEGDLLIPSSSQEVGSHAASTLEAENMEKASKKVEQLQLPESQEQNLKRPYRYNLRKSLAWDSAFFTSEGFLDSEELEIMNSTYSKAMATALPGIQEELRKSSESTPTPESETLALEQPELNLFENVRDSFKKSLGSYNHTTKMIHLDKKKEPKKAEASLVRTLKKVDISSQKLKPPSVLRRHDVTRQEHTSKDGLVCLKVPSHGIVVSKSSLRPPKVSSKTILPTVMPGQKSSFAITQIKDNTGKALPGATAKRQPAVVYSNANEVNNIAHRTTSLTRYVAGSSQTDLVLASALGSSSTCPTSSSDSKSVSSQAIVKKRSAEKTVHSSFRASKIPLKTSRIGAANSNRPYLPKSSLVLSKVSPTSSIDSVASESSSTSTSMMLVMSLEGYDASSQNSDSLSQTFTEDPTKSCANSHIGTKPAKPSALRVPRPTVGYFDKERTQVHRTNKVLKSGLQGDLNAGVHAIATTNKMKPCNIPTLRDGALPSTLLKQGTNPAEVQGVHMKIENHQVLSPKVNNFSSEIAEVNHRINLKAGRVHDDRAEKVQTSKKEMPNLFQPSPFAPANEIHAAGKPRTRDQSSYTMQVQLEDANIDPSALDSKREKENLSPALKMEGSSKVLHIEDRYASATEKLGEMISSLSLSAA